MSVTVGTATGVTAQVGRTITYNNDGTLEGSVVWKGFLQTGEDGQNTDPTGLPFVANGNGVPGSAHPDDNRLECYNRTVIYGATGTVTCTASYFGIDAIAGKSDVTFSFSGGVTTEPIETHPDFTSDLAGTSGAPKNGAAFDDETGEFLGFTEFTTPGETDNDNLLGVDNYLTPATNITVSWWQDKQPSPSQTATWDTYINGVSPEDFRKPSGVKNFLLLDESYSQVGNFYQITQSYLGSGDRGWNKDIYEKYVER